MTCDAIVLAAGRGERMRPLTDHCPKPLLSVRGKPLMQWPLEALAGAGVRDVMINTAWLGEQIEVFFGTRFFPPKNTSDPPSVFSHPRGGPGEARDGGANDHEPIERRNATAPPVGVTMHYSREGRDFGGALETAGGIVRVLPQLSDPFWVLAGDVYAPEFGFAAAQREAFAASGELARLWLVPNPAHNPRGDFSLAEGGLAGNEGAVRHTYSTIGLYRHAMFSPPFCSIAAGNPQGIRAALAPILRAAIGQRQVGARLYTGPWVDVGTPERLAQLNLITDA